MPFNTFYKKTLYPILSRIVKLPIEVRICVTIKKTGPLDNAIQEFINRLSYEGI